MKLTQSSFVAEYERELGTPGAEELAQDYSLPLEIILYQIAQKYSLCKRGEAFQWNQNDDASPE